MCRGMLTIARDIEVAIITSRRFESQYFQAACYVPNTNGFLLPASNDELRIRQEPDIVNLLCSCASI